MKIYPAPHYSMGGLWVDYELQTTIPGLFAIGEANFSDHGANRLGASAMMQCLADGYFILPHTVTDYLAGVDERARRPTTRPSTSASARRSERLDAADRRSAARPPPSVFHRRARRGDARHVRDHPRRRRPARGDRRDRARSATSSGRDLRVDGGGDELNQSLEYAGRVADFLELAELMCRDALERDESCRLPPARGAPDRGGRGGPRRRRASRNVAGLGVHRARATSRASSIEELEFDVVEPTTRSYK